MDQKAQQIQELWLMLASMQSSLLERVADRVIPDKPLAEAVFSNIEALNALQISFETAKKPDGYDQYYAELISIGQSEKPEQEKLKEVQNIMDKYKSVVSGIFLLQYNLMQNFIIKLFPISEKLMTIISYNDMKLYETYNEQIEAGMAKGIIPFRVKCWDDEKGAWIEWKK